MKHTVHVTLTASIEVEASSLKQAREMALGIVDVTDGNVFEATAVVFESYPEKKATVRKGISSY